MSTQCPTLRMLTACIVTVLTLMGCDLLNEGPPVGPPGKVIYSDTESHCGSHRVPIPCDTDYTRWIKPSKGGPETEVYVPDGEVCPVDSTYPACLTERRP